MKKRNEKLALHRETIGRLTALVVGGKATGTGDVLPPTASEQDDCTTTNAMVSACICDN